jgi:ectoine hydroxylase-related dioxygenase (phytanoyl-CoA dioxygenase family)
MSGIGGLPGYPRGAIYMPALQHFSADAAAENLLAAIRSDGAIIIDELVSADTIAALRLETDPYMEASQDGADDFSGRATTRTGGLVSRSAGVRELIQHPLILALCDGFLLENCERYQLHLSQIIRLRPGQGTQMIHRDKWAWGTHLAHLEPQLNTIWALSDFTCGNGATVVAPGSGEWPDQRQPQPDELTQAEMAEGSVLVYTGSVFHGGGHNHSDDDRVGLNITYALGWLRQEENQYLSTPPELARHLEPGLQELIGYAMGQYALGYYTPPGPPGGGPETVSPAFAIGGEEDSFTMGSAEDLQAALSRTIEGGVDA